MRSKFDLERYMDLLLILVYKEWIVKYKRTILGFLWSIIYPFILSFAFYIAFKSVLKIPTKNFSIIIIPAVFIWQWIANSLLVSQWSFVTNAIIIKKYPIPKWILVLANNIIDTIHFILATPIILGVILINVNSNFNFLIFVVGYIALVLLQLLFNFSISLIFATLNVFFRDVDRLLLISLNILIFLTPVFYTLENFPANYKIYFYINPITPFIEAWRHLFLVGTLNINFIISIIYTLLCFLISLFIYKRAESLIAEIV